MKNKSTSSKISRLHSILETLKKDHNDLREMIEVLTNETSNVEKKKTVYADFSKLLKAHAKTEEKAVYKIALQVEKLKMATFEAYEEHATAAALMQKVVF